MKVAFYGVSRKYQELSLEYRQDFTRFHLELPAYYAEFGGNDVTVVTQDWGAPWVVFPSGGSLCHQSVDEWLEQADQEDLVIHWRKWFPEAQAAHPEAVHVVHTCDHSYPLDWVKEVQQAYLDGKLYGLDCYPGWHKQQLYSELGGVVPPDRLFDGHTFGVDTEIYRPHPQKADVTQMLWASDPGRGLALALPIAIKLWQCDKRFRLHVCVPDYAAKTMAPVNHPAVVWHGFVPNGPALWDLFNKETGLLLYPSTFREPSSRAVRQAQAAGSVVLYPPGMGTPSEYIRDGVDGYVRDSVNWGWVRHILELKDDPRTVERVSSGALCTALSERWSVQAQRFNKRFERILEERKRA